MKAEFATCHPSELNVQGGRCAACYREYVRAQKRVRNQRRAEKNGNVYKPRSLASAPEPTYRICECGKSRTVGRYCDECRPPNPCKACRKEAPEGKRYCSAECKPAPASCSHCGGPKPKHRSTCSEACADARIRASVEARSNYGHRTPEARAKRRRAKAQAYTRADKHVIIRDLAARQRGVCAVCDEPGTERTGLVLDHDHVTGEARLLLCIRCNAAFGMMRECPVRIRALLAYAECCYEARHKVA